MMIPLFLTQEVEIIKIPHLGKIVVLFIT